MIQLIGDAIIFIGLIFMIFGVLGIIVHRDFYARLLSSSKIDTVGFTTIIIGFIVKNGFSFFTLKVFIIWVIIMILNPITSHAIANAAYKSGYFPRRK